MSNSERQHTQVDHVYRHTAGMQALPEPIAISSSAMFSCSALCSLLRMLRLADCRSSLAMSGCRAAGLKLDAMCVHTTFCLVNLTV